MQQTVTAARGPILPPLAMGRFRLSLVPDGPQNVALALRGLCFRDGESDRDAFDPSCHHASVTGPDGQTVAAFRLKVFAGPERADTSYSAAFYDLSRLSGHAGPALELGRFCLHPDWHDPDILRLSWAALTRIVDAHAVTLLFGCSSFAGIDPLVHRDAFAHLAGHHLAPPTLAPQRKAEAVDYPALVANRAPDPKRAMASLPPLLRTYLAMGGWVSDHAVIDRDLNTLHVFTGVEIARIPPARARLLRALADSVIDLPPLSD